MLTQKPDRWEQAEDRRAEQGERARDLAWTRLTQIPEPEFMMTGKYLLELLERCSDEKFGQDAIDFAITTGEITLTYNLEADCRRIFAPVAEPETPNAKPETVYDRLCATWRQVCRENDQQLVDSYIESGLMEEILRPVPLAVQTPVVARASCPSVPTEEAA